MHDCLYQYHIILILYRNSPNWVLFQFDFKILFSYPCVFIEVFIHILFKVLEHNCCFESLSSVPTKLLFLGPLTMRLLASGRSAWLWLLTFVSLCWDLGIWNCDVCGVSWCRFLVSPLLGVQFFGCCSPNLTNCGPDDQLSVLGPLCISVLKLQIIPNLNFWLEIWVQISRHPSQCSGWDGW